VATIHRRDRVVLEMIGYDRRFRVPHDLAHAVTERQLSMPRGVFGSIAGGAVFDSMRVIEGRPRHDAAARSKRITAANKTTLGIAEVIAGAVHDAAERYDPDPAPSAARRAWSIFTADPFPWPDDQIIAATTTLAALTVDLEAAGTLSFTWPDGLTSPVPDIGYRR
jgi:hypothetical protein